jgi:hypothetical protein|tara:strand:- start:57 stop:368 length:312 start_codon:yes stop_codon:yes gene_type:complete
MKDILANVVTKVFGFDSIHDNITEIDQSNLINAIPYLILFEPQLINEYKYSIRECYNKGIQDHKDAAKILRRILKKHGRALIWRRTTRRDSGKCVAVYKYRMV